MVQRGRKRKTIYDRANEGNELVSDDEDPDVGARSGQDDDFMGNLDDLDAVMGDTFSEDRPAQPLDRDVDAMPSRAEQWRPEDSTMDEGTGAAHVQRWLYQSGA